MGALPPALALGGLGYKYINEALSWKEEEGDYCDDITCILMSLA